MTFHVGQRVVTTALAPFVDDDELPIGSAGVVIEVDRDVRLSGRFAPYKVHFDCMGDAYEDSGDGWWCTEEGLKLEPPLPSIHEALTGLKEILTLGTK